MRMKERTIRGTARDPLERHIRPALLAGFVLSACSPGLPERGPVGPQAIAIDAAPISSGMKGRGSAMDPLTDVRPGSQGRAAGKECGIAALEEGVRREVSARSHELRMIANMGILGPLAPSDKERALTISDGLEALLAKNDLCRSEIEYMKTLDDEAERLILMIRLNRVKP